MKKLIVTSVVALFCFVSNAQEKPKMPSPPATVVGKVNEANITIKYHQPSIKGRKVWEALAPYGKVWRTGANNATTIEIDQDIKIEGKALAKGKYALFSIPGEKEWTIIINSKAAQWGAYSYKENEDVLRVTVPTKKSSEFNEVFLIVLDKNVLSLNWENVKVGIKLN